MDLRLIEPFTSRHHGVVTIATATRSGVSLSTWYRAHDEGVLERVYPGVSRIVGAPITRQQEIIAAVLAAGSGAMASHRTAASLWGVPRPDTDPIDIILPARSRWNHPGRVVVHRPRDHADLVPVLRASIPTTNVLRTLCDLGAVDPDSVSDAVGHVLAARWAKLGAIEKAVIRHSERGRHGIVALRAAVQSWSIQAKPADSVLEKAMGDLFRRFRLPPFEFHPVIDGREVDFRIAGTNILIECDGWTTHGLDRRQFRDDRRRDIVHTGSGYVTVRLSYEDIVSRPAWTAGELRRVLTTWAPHLLVA
jgi:very-short-patch-repair endonuclease